VIATAVDNVYFWYLTEHQKHPLQQICDRAKRRCLILYDSEVLAERAEYDLFRQSCSKQCHHCLYHVYTLNEKPPGCRPMRLRIRGYDFLQMILHYFWTEWLSCKVVEMNSQISQGNTATVTLQQLKSVHVCQSYHRETTVVFYFKSQSCQCILHVARRYNITQHFEYFVGLLYFILHLQPAW